MSPMPAVRQPFQAFLEQHHDAVRGFLRGMVGPDDADDCLQETFLAALRAYRRFDGRSPRAWVLTIARRKALDHHRARARHPEPVGAATELDGAGGRPVVGQEPEAPDAGVWRSVAALPPGQRAALLLRFAADLPYREVGEALGCSEDAARRRVHDGLAGLRANESITEALEAT